MVLSRFDAFHTCVINVCLFLFPALCLVAYSGYSYAPAILLILAVVSCFLKRPTVEFNRYDYLFMLSLLVYTLTYYLAVVLDGFHLRELDRPTRFLFAVLVFLFIIRFRLNSFYFSLGCMLGVIGGAVFACYQVFFLNMHRAQGHDIAIAFGNHGMMLGLICFVFFCYFQVKKHYILSTLACIACVAGVCTSLLSGTRGGWLALLLIAFILYFSRRILQLPMRSIYTVSCIIILLLASAFFIDTVRNRATIALNNTIGYFDEETAYQANSTSMRLELWKSAWYSFTEAPLFGVGEQDSHESKRRQIDEGLVQPEVLFFGHTHNELLNALSQRGLIGFLALCLSYFLPLLLFLRYAFAGDGDINDIARVFYFCGALVALSYLIFGLTQSMFSHNSGVMVYSFMLVFCWTLGRQSIAPFNNNNVVSV